IAKGKHPVTCRTRKLSPSAPMVLRGGPRGRVGHRRTCLKRVAPDVVERPSSFVWPVSVIQSRLASTGPFGRERAAGAGLRREPAPDPNNANMLEIIVLRVGAGWAGR